MSQSIGNSHAISEKKVSLDSSQLEVVIRLLNISAAQIYSALDEGENEINSLLSSFTQMALSINSIAEAHSDTENNPGEFLDTLQSDCIDVQGKIQKSIMSLQFYDRLSQRLDHIKQTIESLSFMLSDNNYLCHSDEWDDVIQKTLEGYSTQEENRVFDALLAGTRVDKAVNANNSRSDSDDVEIF